MRFEHPDHPELGVRLGYGLNLVPTENLAGVLAGLEQVAIPLRERLAPAERAFGIGAWLPADVAATFVENEADREAWLTALADGGLDPFTFNAFPAGDFHRRGLKAGVFRPTWGEPERLAFTLAVARLATCARAARGGSREGQHLSISTHAGRFGAWRDEGERERCAEDLVRAALELARLEAEHGERVVLALEPEPRSSANDTRELEQLFTAIARTAAARKAEAAAARHLGACLDTCHAAVEFERPAEALERATAHGVPLGKLQFSSALALCDPRDALGREQLLAMDEPTYLHQVTARRGAALARVADLPELRARCTARDPGWIDADEWRCHFHVPVDLAVLGEGDTRLRTTRSDADELLAEVLAHPERWGSRELHVEVETYTWSVLRRHRALAGELVEGLEREWRHAAGRLAAAGWRAGASEAPGAAGGAR